MCCWASVLTLQVNHQISDTPSSNDDGRVMRDERVYEHDV